MRNSVKTALFISAFSPCLISVALARAWSTHTLTWDEIYYFGAGTLGCLVITYIISALRWHGEEFVFHAKKIEANDAALVGVMSTYFFPFIGKAADVSVGAVLALTAAVATVLWFQSSIIPNPLLRALSYRFYKAETDTGVVYTLITRRELIDPRNIRLVKRITSSMLMEVAGI